MEAALVSEVEVEVGWEKAMERKRMDSIFAEGAKERRWALS